MKVKQRAKIENKDGWLNFFDWAKSKIESVINKGDLWEHYANAQHIEKLSDNDNLQPLAGRWNGLGDIFKNLNKIEDKIVDKDGQFSLMLQQYEAMTDQKQQSKIKALKQMASDYGIEVKAVKKIKPAHNLEDTMSLVLKRYAMLKYMENHSLRGRWTAETGRTIANYINVVDLTSRK